MTSRIHAPVLFSVLCAGLSAIPASAQLAELTTASKGVASSANPAPAASPFSSQRESEYAALARDVATLDREFSIVKRVVKLVTPAVVHIESKPLPKFQGLLRVEEAGSGVIVQLGSRVLCPHESPRHPPFVAGTD